MLVCRKREKSGEPVWWDDLKGKVRQTAREKAAEFEKKGITGVDLYISTFGPVLSIISENWPVLTSETDPKTGDPMPLQAGRGPRPGPGKKSSTCASRACCWAGRSSSIR